MSDLRGGFMRGGHKRPSRREEVLVDRAMVIFTGAMFVLFIVACFMQATK
jgi:hypothetical protein